MNIKLIVLDVDGTLTDGTFYYGDSNLELKAFNTKDGAVIIPLGQLNIDVVLLTGRESEAVTRRAADFGATAVQNISDKVGELRKLFTERGISPEQTAYIGDDLNDYAAMKLCGFKACPADAAEEIKEICDYISVKKGGHGAVREICEHLLKKVGRWAELLREYGVEK